MIENTDQLLQAVEQMGRMQQLVESYRAKTLPQSPRNFLLYASGPLEQMRQLTVQITEYLDSAQNPPSTQVERETEVSAS